MRKAFSVDGVPPKKDGANSMWRKSSELVRLKSLRQAAFDAFNGELITAGRVELTLRVHADVSAGDLDNFITGVCDGLMAAHPRTPIADIDWSDVADEIRPCNAVTFRDDSCIALIHAERVSPADRPHYEVELSW